MKEEITIQSPTEKYPIFPAIWIIVFTVVSIYALGVTYKNFRFLANYQVTKAKVVNCIQKYNKGSKNSPPYFTFDLYVEGIDYPIVKRNNRVSIFKSWNKKPKYDWSEWNDCRIITVYYFDKLEVATTFKDQNTKPTYFNLLFSIGSGESILGLIVLFIMSIAAIILGGRFLFHSVKHIYKGFELPTTSSGSSILSSEYWLDIFVPSAVLVLTIILVVLLGLVLAKGMLFVESKNAFISGLLIFIGAVISTFGPGLIVKGVYYLKVRTKKIVKAIKNLILLATLGKLVTNLIIFFFKYNFREFNEESIREFLMQTISALIAV